MADMKSADPNLVHRIATGYMGTCVLLAALELNIFDSLTGKPMTAHEMADALGLDPKPVERLMVALTALKLLDRTDGAYRLTPETQRYLVKSSPSYFGDYYRFEVRHCLMPDFIRLDELIRENRAIMADDWGEYMADPEKARMFSLGQHSASLGGGRLLAAVFDFSPFKAMVDLAGGTGACSIAACQRNPQLKSTIVDFPNVVALAEEIIAREGLSDRITTQPGDLTRDDWPQGDLMLISLCLSGFSEERQMEIFHKCYEKLPSGGAIVIHDFLMNNDYRGPLLAGLYNLTSLEGVPLSGQDMSGRLEAAGFVNPEVRRVIPEYTGIVTAQKP